MQSRDPLKTTEHKIKEKKWQRKQKIRIVIVIIILPLLLYLHEAVKDPYLRAITISGVIVATLILLMFSGFFSDTT